MTIDPITVAALGISLVAFFATAGQLLQRYFAPANGYRQCQQSVMGEWAKSTKLKWRWRELRFETIYYIPKLMIREVHPDMVTISGGYATWKEPHAKVKSVEATKVRPPINRRYTLIGGPMEVDRKDLPCVDLLSMRSFETEDPFFNKGERVCWLSLLGRLNRSQARLNAIYYMPSTYMETGATMSEWDRVFLDRPERPLVVGIEILERSWDFMPAEIFRPLAITTVGDLATFTLRLGMEWKAFDPVKGHMIAEGKGHLISSRIVKSIGIVVEYSSTSRGEEWASPGPKKLLEDELLPVPAATALLFGKVLGNDKLSTSRNIGTLDEIMSYLQVEHEQSTTLSLQDVMAFHPGWVPGFNDIIALVSPTLSSKFSCLNRLPMPNIYHPGILATSEGLQVFSQRLFAYVESTPSKQLQDVLRRIQLLSRDVLWTRNQSDSPWNAPYFTGDADRSAVGSFLNFQSAVLDHIAAAESYLVTFQSDHNTNNQGSLYDKLIFEHIRMAVGASQKSPGNTGKRPAGFPGQRDWLVDTMEVYWDEMHTIADRMLERYGCPRETTLDAWVTMIFRAFCWHHCHGLVLRKVILPSEWYESQMPVYIG